MSRDSGHEGPRPLKVKERQQLARACYARYMLEYAERNPNAHATPWAKLKPVIRQLWTADAAVVEMGGESTNMTDWVRPRMKVWVKEYFDAEDAAKRAHLRRFLSQVPTFDDTEAVLEKLAPGEPDPRD